MIVAFNTYYVYGYLNTGGNVLMVLAAMQIPISCVKSHHNSSSAPASRPRGSVSFGSGSDVLPEKKQLLQGNIICHKKAMDLMLMKQCLKKNY